MKKLLVLLFIIKLYAWNVFICIKKMLDLKNVAPIWGLETSFVPLGSLEP